MCRVTFTHFLLDDVTDCRKAKCYNNSKIRCLTHATKGRVTEINYKKARSQSK